jgi:hypothetical protein
MLTEGNDILPMLLYLSASQILSLADIVNKYEGIPFFLFIWTMRL